MLIFISLECPSYVTPPDGPSDHRLDLLDVKVLGPLRRREEKEIEKMIKLANRAQAKMGERGQREEVKEVSTKGIYTFEVDSVPKNESSSALPESI